MINRPTLLNSCAFAATAAEARFRINGRPQPHRSTSVVALDGGAAGLVEELSHREWLGARFLTLPADSRPGPAAADLKLLRPPTHPVLLSQEIADIDFMLMIATTSAGAVAATTIGHACVGHGIMTAGVVLGDHAATHAAVAALRPFARVLLVTTDREDVAELMDAVGA